MSFGVECMALGFCPHPCHLALVLLFYLVTEMMDVAAPPDIPLLSPEEACWVWQFLLSDLLVFTQEPNKVLIESKLDFQTGIYSVSGVGDPLSNFWCSTFIAANGSEYPSREHWIVREKLRLAAPHFPIGEVEFQLLQLPSASQAKRFGKESCSPSHLHLWREHRWRIVRDTLVRAVFQDETFLRLLLHPWIQEFRHTLPHPDPFWGFPGENHHGQLLMLVRQFLIESASHLVAHYRSPVRVTHSSTVFLGHIFQDSDLRLPHTCQHLLSLDYVPPNVAVLLDRFPLPSSALTPMSSVEAGELGASANPPVDVVGLPRSRSAKCTQCPMCSVVVSTAMRRHIFHSADHLPAFCDPSSICWECGYLLRDKYIPSPHVCSGGGFEVNVRDWAPPLRHLLKLLAEDLKVKKVEGLLSCVSGMERHHPLGNFYSKLFELYDAFFKIPAPPGGYSLSPPNCEATLLHWRCLSQLFNQVSLQCRERCSQLLPVNVGLAPVPAPVVVAPNPVPLAVVAPPGPITYVDAHMHAQRMVTKHGTKSLQQALAKCTAFPDVHVSIMVPSYCWPRKWPDHCELQRLPAEAQNIALGFHPTQALEFRDESQFLGKFLAKLQLPGVCAIGEVGLDYNHIQNESRSFQRQSKEQQKQFLQVFAEVAQDKNLPIVITAFSLVENIAAVNDNWEVLVLSYLRKNPEETLLLFLRTALVGP